MTEQKQKTLLREFLCPQCLKAVKPFWSFHSAAQAAAGWAETPIAHAPGLCSLVTFHQSHNITNQGKEINPAIQHQSDREGNAELLIHTRWKLLPNVMITISTSLIGFDTVNIVYVNRAICCLCSSLLWPECAQLFTPCTRLPLDLLCCDLLYENFH